MRRRQIFIDEAAGIELVLPVSPPGYAWENGVNMETVNIDGLGDLVLPGRKALDTRPVDCLFPAHAYPFNEPEAVLNPFVYVEQFEKWAQGRTPLRYIVSGTPLNAAVYIQSIKYAEEDGTNNVNAVLTLRQFQDPEVPKTAAGTASGPTRPTDTQAAAAKTYPVQAGDTLGAIARKFYGDAGKYPGLAAANGIQNPHLIHPGQVLTIPELGKLPAGKPVAARPRSERAAEATTATYDEEKKTWKSSLDAAKENIRTPPMSRPPAFPWQTGGGT